MSLLVLDQAEQASQHDPVTPSEDSIVVWGPVSVEAVSSDDKLITMEAIENALPQLYRRKTGSVLHKDQTVGDVHPLVEADSTTAPTEEAETLVEHLVSEHGGLPTDVFPVTEQIAEAFPHLSEHVGEPVFFAAMEVFGDSQTSQTAQSEIQNGNLDSYSLSGAPVEDAEVRVCEADECRSVQRIDEMDLSAVTLGSRTENASPLGARVRNPGAAFRLVQQAETEQACCEECEQLQESESNPPHGGPHKDTTNMTETTTEDPDTTEQEDDSVEEGANEQVQELLLELRNRLESLETDMATMKGQATDQDENPEDEDEAEEADDDEEDDEEEEMEEASPSLPSAEEIGEAVAQALTQDKDADQVEQAGAGTPEPATPSSNGEGTDQAELIEQAIDSGDPGEFKLALRKL